MSNLKFFLSQNALKIENTKYIVSNRFLDEEGNPISWEIKAITSEEDEELRNLSTRKIRNKQGGFTEEFNPNKYMCKLVTACTVYPNLLDVDLQNSYGVMGSEALIRAMLYSGEYTKYIAKVQEVNGFDITMDNLVEEAKN